MSGGIDLGKEPVSLSVTEDPAFGRIGFSDVPEQLLPALTGVYGDTAVARIITPSPVELEFYQALPEGTRTRPRFLDLVASGELPRRVGQLLAANPTLPERRAPYFMAAINRSDEPILGRTGAIYFVCHKGCYFCHYRHFDERTLDAAGIAERMLALQAAGADNIQWVSPSEYTRILVLAVHLAAQKGFSLPIVHKSEGEDGLEELGLLEGIVDLYLPDVKFARPETAPVIGLSARYPDRMRACIREMYRQVGGLKRKKGVALAFDGGVLVRHLLMPNGVEESKHVFQFLASVAVDLPVHVMTSYEPLHEAKTIPSINRHVTVQEVSGAVDEAQEADLTRVYVS